MSKPRRVQLLELTFLIRKQNLFMHFFQYVTYLVDRKKQNTFHSQRLFRFLDELLSSDGGGGTGGGCAKLFASLEFMVFVELASESELLQNLDMY